MLQRIAKEVTERKKSAVALVADGKKDSPKGIEQPQGKRVPVMTATSDGVGTLNSFLTEFLNEAVLQNGAVAISERGVRGFGLGFHVMEVENLHVEEEILDVMEAENLHVIEEERSVPVSAPRKPKRIRLVAPQVGQDDRPFG